MYGFIFLVACVLYRRSVYNACDFRTTNDALVLYFDTLTSGFRSYYYTYYLPCLTTLSLPHDLLPSYYRDHSRSLVHLPFHHAICFYWGVMDLPIFAYLQIATRA